MKSCLVSIKVGDPVMYSRGEGELVKGTIQDFYLTVNGMNHPELIGVIIARLETGSFVSATADKFFSCDDGDYEKCYPSVRLGNVSDKWRAENVK